MKKVLWSFLGLACVSVIMMFIAFFLYSAVGTSGSVEEIKRIAPAAMKSRNWEIIRYEGWQYGSFDSHGGKVWYHVRNIDNHSIQYRVYITLWAGELHYMYGKPEPLSRVNIDGLNINLNGE